MGEVRFKYLEELEKSEALDALNDRKNKKRESTDVRGSGRNLLLTEGAGIRPRIRPEEGAQSQRGSRNFFGRKRQKKTLFITSGDRRDSEHAVPNRSVSFTEGV